MKTTKHLFLLFLPLLFTSCAYRYQVFDVDSNQLLTHEDDLFFYEDHQLGIYYDFWAEGGVMIFKVLNKSNKLMTIDLKASQFTINGRSLSYSNPYGAINNDLRKKLSLPSKIEIAPNQTVQIDGFPVTWQWHKMNNNEQINHFRPEQAPIQFHNKIVFTLDMQEVNQQVDNYFHIASIEKMRKEDFYSFEKNARQKSDKFFVYNEQADKADFWADMGLQLLLETLLFF